MAPKQSTPGESTPGPWVADECGAHVHAADKTIFHASVEIDEDTPANMRLIAAAPDLLRACDLAEAYASVAQNSKAKDEILFLLRAAILKARGQ